MNEIDWAQRRVVIEPRAWAEALGRFREVVGAQHVITDDGALQALGRATVPGARSPSAVVYPGSADEVAEVVKTASVFGIPVWPCSKGRNWGYGSATPFLGDTVLLHLERLNRIIEVNEKLAYAVLEPGVTYRQLKEHLDRHHPSLWCDCSDGPPDGSVVGNALERGLGVTSYNDHFGTLCGLEVVLADGSKVRTGGGEPGHCHTWNTHKWGLGPYLEGLFSQSNLGVVTKAGVWLLRRPEAFVSFTFDLAREVDLPRMIDIIRELTLRGVLAPGTHVVNDICALSVVSQYPRDLVGKCSRLPDDVVREMCARLTVPRWAFGGGIMGTHGQVRAVRAELIRSLRGLGRLTFITDGRVRVLEAFGALVDASKQMPIAHRTLGSIFRALTGKSMELLPLAPKVHSVMKGQPSDYFVRHAYFKSPLPKPEDAHPDRDDVGGIWFAPIVPCTGDHVTAMLELCRPLFEYYAFDFYAALLMQNSRSMIVLMSIFYDKGNTIETARAQTLYDALSAKTRLAGYQTYRTGTQGMAGLYKSAPEFAALVRRLKHALDPAGVLAPGKTPP
jgi:4-cresol dehydrogenase (hydroxylating)